MSEPRRTITAAHGELLVRTGVTGRASKMGHRLTIEFTSWTAEVVGASDSPTSVVVTVDVDSLQVRGGEGGVTPMFGPEKAVARSNALKVFEQKRFPHIVFRSTDIEETDSGHRLTGELEIHGVTRPHVVELRRNGADLLWENAIRQTDFGLKPYSQLMGAMKVVDEVTVSVSLRPA